LLPTVTASPSNNALLQDPSTCRDQDRPRPRTRSRNAPSRPSR